MEKEKKLKNGTITLQITNSEGKTESKEVHNIEEWEKYSDWNKFREYVSTLWEEVFYDTEYCPIDVHTPLWLWSRNGFAAQIEVDKDNELFQSGL